MKILPVAQRFCLIYFVSRNTSDPKLNHLVFFDEEAIRGAMVKSFSGILFRRSNLGFWHLEVRIYKT